MFLIYVSSEAGSLMDSKVGLSQAQKLATTVDEKHSSDLLGSRFH